MPDLDVITFGCRLNALESDRIRTIAGEAGMTGAVIVNTCAVTAEAERQARQAIRRARRGNPAARIVVTGCAATLSPTRYAAMPEVDLVLDNTAKLQPESYRRDPGTPAAAPRAAAGGATARVRGYLQVQQGCDHRCTFCIIPYARGPSRSLPFAAIAEEARRLVEAGVREVVLTGVDLTAYGGDLPGRPTLGRLVRDLLAAVPELGRLRLSSLDPSEIDDDLWQVLGMEERLMPHLHFSLQSGDDLILKRMKRRHSRAQAVAAARHARALRPDIAIGADLIAGFPTETEEMFRRSLDIVAECAVAFVHVFPYSARSGTPAARMPPVAPELVRERAARLRAAGAAALADDLARRVGGEDEVLVEQPGKGRAGCYATVSVDGAAPVGALRRMRFTGAGGGRLVGVAV